MGLEAEALVDRRRLKRRLGLWRFLAVIAILMLGVGFALKDQDLARAVGLGPHIARVDVSGVITDDEKLKKLLDRLSDRADVRAVILEINSPGGTTTGGEALFGLIRKISEKKPVVAVCGTIATSAAYMIALATDRIIVRGNTLTGSVGVILQWAEVTALLDKLGVKVEEVRSGPLKAIPSPFQPLDEKGKALTEELVQESKDWFFGLVAERRPINLDGVPGLKDGRVYSGRQAVDLKLADQIGGEDEAKAWIKGRTGIDLKVREWKPEPEDGLGWFGAAESIARGIGLPQSLVNLLVAARDRSGVHLDGLISVWHPQAD